jgi:hypothetical protein
MYVLCGFKVFPQYFCLVMEGSGSVLVTNGSGWGAGREAQKYTDTDPQHCCLVIKGKNKHENFFFTFLQKPKPHVPEFIDPVFTKTSQKRSFSLYRKRAFWLVLTKTGSIISGTGPKGL